MKTSSTAIRSKNIRPRYIWIFVAALVVAAIVYSLIQFSDVLNSDSTDVVIEPSNSRDVLVGVRPASFQQINEFQDRENRRLRLSGEAEANTVVVLTNRGERLRQVSVNELGQWGMTLDIEGGPMVLEAQLFLKDGDEGIRSEETIFRLPVPSGNEAAAETYDKSALIMVTAPGRPSRIIQSPFGGTPTSGPLSLSVIEYDYTGGVIITGTSAVPGRIRLYAQDAVIGETGIGVGGRWNYIAGRILPRGQLKIKAELIPAAGALNAPDAPVSVSVPFQLLPQLREDETEGSGALSVNFDPTQWQVRRTLIGGGGQSTVIFSPSIVD